MQRNRAIHSCIEASLEDREEGELARLGELAILPEDENIPLAVIEALWAESGSLDEDETDDLVRRFDSLSLLQTLDLGGRTLRLHDNMMWYLRDRIGPEGCRAAHQAMIRGLGTACNRNWRMLPAQHAYSWRFLIRHMRGAASMAKLTGFSLITPGLKRNFMQLGSRSFSQATCRNLRKRARGLWAEQ
jgi:hypothetical protein